MTTSPALPTGYEFSSDPGRIDVERVHRLLLENASWAQGRDLETQEAIVAASRNFGIYLQDTGEQVAYARIVTDGVTFAWLADVVVDPAHQGRGLGRDLVDGLLAVLAPLDLKRIVLKASPDARTLYERAGWTPLDGPEDWMVRSSRR